MLYLIFLMIAISLDTKVEYKILHTADVDKMDKNRKKTQHESIPLRSFVKRG